LHVSRPMLVSKSTVGPVGTAGGSSRAITEGASGSALDAAAGAVCGGVAGAVAGGGVVSGGVVWAKAAVEQKASVQSRAVRANFGFFIPPLRLLHPALTSKAHLSR
jgi:hypothetical protein